MPTRHRRIQVTEDPELARALQNAAPHLPAGLSRARRLRDLAIVGAERIGETPRSEADRRELLERLAESFEDESSGGVDLAHLREGKGRAWPTR